MPRVLKRPLAEADLEEIWLYVARDDVTQADRLLDLIEERCCSLARFPRMGTSRDDLAPSLRSFSHGNYLIFYLPTEDGIEIVRILQGARDIEALF